MMMRIRKVALDNPFGGEDAYEAKRTEYFAGVRRDWVDRLSAGRDRRILEIGCGHGDTGAYALAEGKCGWYAGVEIAPQAVMRARARISEVVHANVEQIELPWTVGSFDVLFMSEVLEHLIDPWAVLRKVHAVMKHDALVFASSPNVCHYLVILMQLRGDWKLTDSGAMDRTHLRWFTPRSYRRMFEDCGYVVDHVGPIAPLGMKARFVDALTLKRLSHLLPSQVNLVGRVRRP